MVLDVSRRLFVADRLQEKLKSYELVTPSSTDVQGRFISLAVSGAGKRRSKRDSGSCQQAPADGRLYYNVTLLGQSFHLRLKLNSKLVAPGATVEWQDANVTRKEPLRGDCVYSGDITDVPGTSVAISNCDGLVSNIPARLPQQPTSLIRTLTLSALNLLSILQHKIQLAR